MAARLSDRMIAEMEMRGLKEETRKQYLYDVEKFFAFYKDKSPVKIGVEDIKSYMVES